MDLNQFSTANEPVFMELRHPGTDEVLKTEAGESIGLTVVGTDSDPFIQKERELLNRRLNKARAKQKADKVTIEELDKEELAKLTACVVDFRNITVSGEALTFTAANATKLFSEFPWIRRQVADFVAESSNFFNPS